MEPVEMAENKSGTVDHQGPEGRKEEEGESCHGDPVEPTRGAEVRKWVEDQVVSVWENLRENNLWRRMLKTTLATTIAIILALIPAVVGVYGKATYLAAMTTVFGHPGRRFGQMAEALVLTLIGTLFGTAWSTLGIYLSSLVYADNAPAAYTIRGIFLAIAVLLHGLLRSHTPRLFLMVLLMIIVCVVSLTGTTTEVSVTLITTLLYPILTATGILLLVNIFIFPEFSSRFLGITTIETLQETTQVLKDASTYFLASNVTPEIEVAPKAKANDSFDTHITAEPKPKIDENEAPPKSYLWKTIEKFLVGKNEAKERKQPQTEAPHIIKLKPLTEGKAELRAKLESCKDAQQECNFELAFAVLPPRDLKAISDTAMKKLVASVIALVGACESKFALVGDGEADESQKRHGKSATNSELENSSRQSSADGSSADEKEDGQNEDQSLDKKSKKNKGKTKLDRDIADLEAVKPRKEIEFGDVELLRLLVKRISESTAHLQAKIDRSVDVITSCLAYCYDVPKLPDGSTAPSGIRLDEIDIWADTLTAAVAEFDKESTIALEGAAALQNLDSSQVDIMPRMEIFLISSFLLNLRQAASQIHEMLLQSRKLVEKRQARHERRRIYAPRINWRKWLTSGGEQDQQALPSKGRKDKRTGMMKDTPDRNEDATTSEQNLLAKKGDEEAVENAPGSPAMQKASPANQAANKTKDNRLLIERVRTKVADVIEYITSSDDVLYAVKLAIAVFLVTWPAFISDWKTWYYLNRGLWAALQLVLIMEVAIGSSVSVFILRAIGTTLGCIWGYVAFETGSGDRVVCVVMLVIGIIPSTYVQLGTPYVKAGMVSIVSMCIVALGTEDQTVPGTAVENFYKRLTAFLTGGVVALVIEFTLFPVKARDRLVESLAASILHINEMEACLAYGIEAETNVDVHSVEVSERFDNATTKAMTALTAAGTFLPFCTKEPRLKGSFAGLALVYDEMIYVLHQIVDRLVNMLHLRKEYGSGVLEELNALVFQYRRNVAGSITLILFAVHEALTTKLPLPQFLPSARLAHLRMVNRVREVVFNTVGESGKKPSLAADQHHESVRSRVELSLVKRVVQQKFLSWSAATAGQTEVIEYLEELIDLTKLLVGANEFHSGMLTRPTFREYVERIEVNKNDPTYRVDKDKLGMGWDLQIDQERAELSNTAAPRKKNHNLVSRGGKTAEVRGKIPTSKNRGVAEEVERQKKKEKDALPMSLQRVRTRRLEDRLDQNKRASSRPPGT